MVDFNIFAPEISVVQKGVEGKTILLYSNFNKVGKTFVACHLPKPLYLRCEQGINGISGVPYMALQSWADYKKVIKQLTNPKTLDQVRQTYSTIIVDTVDVIISWCNKYTCDRFSVERINDANGGYGAWAELKQEFEEQLNKLTNSGLCVVFISHAQEVDMVDTDGKTKYKRYEPIGGKRDGQLVADLVDIIGYVSSNGYDSEGNAILSSCYFADGKYFKAGSRFRYMPRVLKEFTAENLQEAIKVAVEKEEQESGLTGKTKLEQLDMEVKKPTYTEILGEIKNLVMSNKDKVKDIQKIVEKYLGEGVKISQATESQMEQLEMILSDIQDLV